MSTSSRARRLTAVLGALLLVAMPGSASAAAPDRTTLTGNELRVAEPRPGYGVAVSALMVDGSRHEVVYETSVDGITRAVDRAADTLAGGPDACADDRYNTQGFRWTKPYAWRFRASSRPAYMGLSRTQAQLLASVRSITAARNDCGRLDRVDARATFLGHTTRRPGIRVVSDGTGYRILCSGDGRNVVGFGALPEGIAGMTCITFTDPARGLGRAIEADVLFNKRHVRWAFSPRDCSGNEVMLRSVATHELGHVFGLGHVGETSHGNLTMSQRIGPCDGSAYTLGRGDILGLERLY